MPVQILALYLYSLTFPWIFSVIYLGEFRFICGMAYTPRYSQSSMLSLVVLFQKIQHKRKKKNLKVRLGGECDDKSVM